MRMNNRIAAPFDQACQPKDRQQILDRVDFADQARFEDQRNAGSRTVSIKLPSPPVWGR